MKFVTISAINQRVSEEEEKYIVFALGDDGLIYYLDQEVVPLTWTRLTTRGLP